MVYVEQTGRQFSQRYKEHKRAFYSNPCSSSFAQHLHEKAHPFGPIHVMQVLQHHKKARTLTP
jgi:hypothetical protein